MILSLKVESVALSRGNRSFWYNRTAHAFDGGAMSVRFSQLLVAIVLALVAYALFRTVSAYQETAIAADLREHGSHIVERETQRLGERIAGIEGLAAATAMDGYIAREFAMAARHIMHDDGSIDAIDFFNTNDVHVAHVVAAGVDQFGAPPKIRTTRVSHEEIRAVQLALFDAELSRATSVSDIPPLAGAPAGSPAADGLFFLATRVVYHGREVGSIVEIIDVRELVVADVALVAPSSFVLDDGRGRSLQTAGIATIQNQPDTQTFPIPFADRVLELTLAAPPHVEASPWWFLFGWVALVFAIVAPIEVVGHINRRVQALNEELETRVAARTKQLEESLDESRRLAVVVESVHEGVMRIDAAGIIRYVNAALCREQQRLPDDLIGKSANLFEPLGLTDHQLDDIRAGVSETGFVYREMERTRADGARYVAGVTFTRHGLEDSGALIAVSRDVTDRRLLVDELVAAKGNLEREMRARADFIATASHELRTPVTTLRTLAALLLDKLGSRAEMSAEDARLLDILDHETRRLAYLVDDLLKIAKIDAPGAALAAQQLDLRTVVASEVEELQHFRQPAPPLELHLCAEPATVLGDEEALRSIVDNLVGNARKFTAATGRVDVTVETDGERVRFIVADTGVGIPTSDLPHIFERFYRSTKTAAKAQGAGLGLAIVARLVDLMQGTISVASEVGRGTTVTIEYPLEIAPAAHSAQPQKQAR
jgi:PAS domain S-box-containing protein